MTIDETRQMAGPVTRRQLLRVGAGSLAVATAGCLGSGDDETEDVDTPAEGAGETLETADAVPDAPRVEDPPEAVYMPTHRGAMRHLGPREAGEYTVGPMVTYPHQFWTVTGTNTQAVRPGGRGVHLMFTVWDSASETVLPVDIGAEMRTLLDGDVVDTRSPWPMISQTMGFHFGDNIPLPEDGTYTVEVDLNPITTRRTGDFTGGFETGASVRFEFEYNREFRREIVNGVTYIDEEQWGKRGAMEPMGGMAMTEHSGDSNMTGQEDGENVSNTGGTTGQNESDTPSDASGASNTGAMAGHTQMPFSALPPADAYPGRQLGPQESGDARFVVRYVEESRLSEEGAGYLLISPRTPYNNVPLADMALTVSGAVEGELKQTLDSEYGHHYGLSASLSPGDTVELGIDSPPQVARHRGYETAFIDMPSMTVELPE